MSVRGITVALLIAVGSAVSADEIDFNRDVRPILATYCLECHGPDAQTRKARLRFDVEESVFKKRGGSRYVVDREKPERSELLVRIKTDDPDEVMPPADSPRRPSAAEIATLERWIEQGASWREHWAFVSPKRPELPETQDATWPKNEIDSFILARLDREKVAPSRRADRINQLRRVTLDLIGVPPTPAEIDAFLEDDSPDAYERVVDRLLASPLHGEHMALDWLDAARYADTSGYQADWERYMWPWRDWVVDAFNTSLPFDEFTIEQMAGDMLPEPSQAQLIATGFHRNHRVNDEGGSLDAEFEVEYVVDRVDTTSTVFLGLTIGCARCHDHKYDPISQKEYYQLFAFFNNVPEKGIDGRRGAAKPFIEVANRHAEWRVADLERRVKDLKAAKGDAAKGELDAIRKRIEKYGKRPKTPVQVMREQSGRRPTYILRRGQYDQPDKSEQILPKLPAIFGSFSKGTKPDRLSLARWLVSPENPLTARVTVNRIWQHHFGTGLVSTSEDFGVRGERPSHPELLDWLATEFVRLGWDKKALHRLIVTSSTYLQSSRVTPEALKRDPANRLLARGPRRRLTGAAIRDQALFVAGVLEHTLGGPAVKPYQPPGMWKELSFGTGKTSVDFYVQDHGADLYRRGLYTFWKRSVAPPRMSVFDGGGREACRVRSDVTNTPMQALTLQNDVTFVEASRHFAERILREGGESVADRLVFAWRVALSRRPDEAELGVLQRAYARYLAFYRSEPEAAEELLDNGESLRDETLDRAEHAAFTMIAKTLLNLDETMTRE